MPHLVSSVSALGLAIALAGCKQDPEEAPTAPKSRAAAVESKGEPAAVAQPGAAAPSIAAASAPAEPVPSGAPGTGDRKVLKPILCAGQMGQKGRDLPKKAPFTRLGDAGLPAQLPVGDGMWTWVNFWAAWCEPCKQEIPRLKAWGKELASGEHTLRVVFVSIDDDKRQLENFLSAQPPEGLRSTFWLEDGPNREQWLKGIGMEGEPELPAHLLIDPKGKLRCVVQGAVEDKDFPRVKHLLTRRI